jgi:hypothetical protein
VTVSMLEEEHPLQVREKDVKGLFDGTTLVKRVYLKLRMMEEDFGSAQDSMRYSSQVTRNDVKYVDVVVLVLENWWCLMLLLNLWTHWACMSV